MSEEQCSCASLSSPSASCCRPSTSLHALPTTIGVRAVRPCWKCSSIISAHVEGLGWLEPVADGGVAGTVGASLRMEAIQLQLEDAGGARVCYSAHVQDRGWLPTVCDGQVAGTVGESLRMEALKVQLSGAPAGTQVCYTAHVQDRGWMHEVCDGAIAGTVGEFRRLEAVRIRIKNPSRSLPPASAFGVHYQAHVQERGWLGFVRDDAVAGTVGESLRMEAVQMGLDKAPAGTSICYEAHVQNKGWVGEVCDGQTAGSVGEGLRMEAMRARLVNAPEGISVCYRAHVQDRGWLNEVFDGEITGTIGESLRMEAVRIRIRIPFRTLFDDGCIDWVPQFILPFAICEPYLPVWWEQLNRWGASNFSSYFVGLPLSGNNVTVFNPDATVDVPVQIFERGILHCWPEEPSDVASMRLGELDRQLHGVPQSLNAPMPNDFQHIWNTQGGLPVFGFTVTDPGVYNLGSETRFSQWLERARMERKPDGSGIEFGHLGAELVAAGLISQEKKRGRYMALVRCGGCPRPLSPSMPALGDGDTCEEAFQHAESACSNRFRCASSERRFCAENTGGN